MEKSPSIKALMLKFNKDSQSSIDETTIPSTFIGQAEARYLKREASGLKKETSGLFKRVKHLSLKLSLSELQCAKLADQITDLTETLANEEELNSMLFRQAQKSDSDPSDFVSDSDCDSSDPEHWPRKRSKIERNPPDLSF